MRYKSVDRCGCITVTDLLPQLLTYRVSQKRRPIAKILLVDIFFDFTFLIISE